MAAPRLIAIVGPTASGKTALAIDITKRFNGEIICADSRTVYKDMNIGTAKPSAREQASVPHWGLDLVAPNQKFSVADFKTYAVEKIADIQSRGKLALLVGGTGLYVDSVLYDFTFGPEPDEAERARLNNLSVEELQEYCTAHNIPLPQNSLNKRHLVRAIELSSISGISKSSIRGDAAIVGIATKMNTLRTRIEARTEHMFANGVVTEANMLGKKYGWESQAMTGNIYPLLKMHLNGELPFVEAKERISTADYQLAKRQMTWLRRNPDIMWAEISAVASCIERLLARE